MTAVPIRTIIENRKTLRVSQERQGSGEWPDADQ